MSASVASIIAPRSSSSVTASRLPTRAAVISGVSPAGSGAFASAPASSSTPIIAALPLARRDRERRQPVSIGQRRLGARAEQQPRGRDVVHAHGPVQRRRAVAPGGVDVDLLPDQRAHRRRVAPHGRIGQARVVVGGLGRRGHGNQQQTRQAGSAGRHTSPTHGHFTHTTPLDNPFGPDFSKFLARSLRRAGLAIAGHFCGRTLTKTGFRIRLRASKELP